MRGLPKIWGTFFCGVLIMRSIICGSFSDGLGFRVDKIYYSSRQRQSETILFADQHLGVRLGEVAALSASQLVTFKPRTPHPNSKTPKPLTLSPKS